MPPIGLQRRSTFDACGRANDAASGIIRVTPSPDELKTSSTLLGSNTAATVIVFWGLGPTRLCVAFRLHEPNGVATLDGDHKEGDAPDRGPIPGRHDRK